MRRTAPHRRPARDGASRACPEARARAWPPRIETTLVGGRALELAFLGGATTVTGSQFLLTTDRARVLVDCGMFQGSPNEVTRNRLPFASPPREIDALLLTHAHLDHCGLIPALVADGFAGPIYATAGTVELAGLVLLDAAKLQTEFAKRSERRARRQPPPTSDPEAELRAQGPWVETAHEEPLYTEGDVMSALARFRSVRYAADVAVADGVTARFVDAGHILGSAIIEVRAQGRTIVSSGDIGRRGTASRSVPTGPYTPRSTP